MDPSYATDALASIEALTVGALEGMQEWSWAVFTVLAIIALLLSYTKSAVRGDGMPHGVFADWAVSKCLIGALIIGYFTLALPFMEHARQWGMELSGSSQATVPIGEIARQADVVTQRVNDTISSFQSLGWIEQLQAIPELMSLRVMNWFVHVIYIIIALIAFWVYAKFLFGYLVGGFFVGFMGWERSEHYGHRSFSYLLVSAMPLLLLALLQGYSERVLNEAVLPEGIAKISDLMSLIWRQAIILLLCFVTVVVPREWLNGVVGMSGAPSGSTVPQTMGKTGSAVTSSISSAMHAISLGMQGAGKLGNMFGGGGASPSSGGGSSVPRLKFKR